MIFKLFSRIFATLVFSGLIFAPVLAACPSIAEFKANPTLSTVDCTAEKLQVLMNGGNLVTSGEIGEIVSEVTGVDSLGDLTEKVLDQTGALGSGSTAQSGSSGDSNFLSEGFETITGYGDSVENKMVDERGGGYAASGVRDINAVFYNVKDFLKYAAAGIAFLYIIVGSIQLVTASGDEQIDSAKKNILWSAIALVGIFVIDIAVISFFEGGNYEDAAVAGESITKGLFTLEWENGVLSKNPVQNFTLFKSIAIYFQQEASAVFDFMKVMIGAAALGLIALAGFHVINAAGNEESIEKEKKYLMHVVTAFTTLLVLENLIFNFIYPVDQQGLNSPECVEFMSQVATMSDGTVDLSLAPEGCRSAAVLGSLGTQQVLSVVKFFETFLAVIAVFFIVYSGIQIITSFGDEEKLTKYKKTLGWSVAGLAITMMSYTLILKFFFPANSLTGEVATDVSSGISMIAAVANFILTFVSVFAVVSLIVAGVMWVVNFGNSEITDKAKKLVLASVIAIVLSTSAYAIVRTLSSGDSSEQGSTVSVSADVLGGGD